MRINEVTEKVIGAATEVHPMLGRGLPDSVYEAGLCRELQLRRAPSSRQVTLPVLHKRARLDCRYWLDLHLAQLPTYLKMGPWQVGPLIDSNVPVLGDGIRRQVLSLQEGFSAPSAPLRSRGPRREQ